MIHSNGVLYGEVNRGGANGTGGLFAYSIDQDSYELIYSFDNGIEGSEITSLVLKGDKLYGTRGTVNLSNESFPTSFPNVVGGPSTFGIVFEYDLSNNTFTTLKTLLFGQGEDDIYGYGDVLSHTNGKIYFYGGQGGTDEIGGLLELNPADNSLIEYDIVDPNNTATYNGNPRYLVEDASGLILSHFDIRDNNLTPRENHGIFTFDTGTGVYNELSTLRYPGSSIALTGACINPYARIESNTIEVCLGDQLEIVLNSPNSTSYEWSKDGSAISGKTSDVLDLGMAEVDESGVYRAILTNPCGTVEVVFEVSVKDVVSDLTINSISCTGFDDGSIRIDQTSGGTAPFEYSLDGLDYQTSDIFENLIPGTYSLFSRDAVGCEGVQTFTIEEPLPLSLIASFDGVQVTVVPTGGTEPYTYSLNGIDFQESPNFLLANGQYTFTVRDANDCELTIDEAIVVTSIDIPQQSIQIYPNPVQDILHLKGAQGSLFRIIDSKGVTVLESSVQADDEQLSLQFLKPGIYLLEMVNDSEEMPRLRLVKN